MCGVGRGEPSGATEEQRGLWRIRPLKDLRPGEYGLFAGSDQSATTIFGKGTAGILFDFGIEK